MLNRLAALEDRHRDLSFEELRRSILSGEPTAWKRFVEKHSRFVYAVALKLLASRVDREDDAIATYTRVFERLAADGFRLLRGFHGRARFTTYLYRIVQSESRDHVARQSARSRPPPVERSAAAVPAPEGPVLRPDLLRRAVREALDSLAAEERLTLMLRFRDGLKLREIASVLGSADVGAAARTLYRALERLDPLRLLGARCRLGSEEMALLGASLDEELSRTVEAAEGDVRRP